MTCPTHGGRIYGGPIQYWCDTGDHTVHAADINREHQAVAS
jgi:hypothetical protein